MKHKEKVVRQSSNGIGYLMKKNRVDVAAGFGRVAGSGRVSVTSSDGSETVYSAKNILIATGSTPRSLPGIEIDHLAILSSDSILELTEIPKSLVVIGSGAVGVEFASMYARFGSKATVVEILPRIVPLEDEEICVRMTQGRRALIADGREEHGPYQSPMEDGMVHFHEFIRREIAQHV